MERVRQVLGVRHVIRVCSSAEHAKVMAAAERLLEHADVIRRSGVNLAGMTLPKAQFTCYTLFCSEAGPLLANLSEALWLGHARRLHQHLGLCQTRALVQAQALRSTTAMRCGSPASSPFRTTSG